MNNETQVKRTRLKRLKGVKMGSKNIILTVFFCCQVVAFVLFSMAEASAATAESMALTASNAEATMATTSTTPEPVLCRPSCTSNGYCDAQSGKCVCNPGWMGDRCHLCGGKVKLNSSEGWLADAVGNYTVDSKCTWLIEAPSSQNSIRLHLKEFATECGWDHLYIFDGDSVFSDVIGVLSGMTRQERYAVRRVPELVGTSGHMLIHFYSDVAYNMTGFNITFGIDTCPSQRHDLTCSGHGSCVRGQCLCDEDFKGDACNVPACPQNCEPEGIRRGVCNRGQKRCDCFEGWTGEDCSQAVDNGFWKVLKVEGSVPPARTSHAAMVDTRGRMWVVGGETFMHTRHVDMVATFSPDLTNNEVQGIWRPVHAKGEKGPSPRFGHSAVIHEDKIYMYGGTMRSGHVSRELWALDLSTLIWERVETSQGQCMASDGAKLCGPINSMGHTAHVVSNRMIVIFGHSPKYGYLDTVQEYHFFNKEWSIPPTTGFPVRGGFGHSSVWDDITNRIYVYGGYVSTAPTAAVITNSIFSLDPITKHWKRHSSSSSYRYLHSAVASAGLMIVFGGNTHNDTSVSHGAKCYSADVLAYDMVCDKWYNMGSSLPSSLDADLPRYGHTAVVINGTMILHGGFNGVLTNDTLIFNPGKCEVFKEKSACLEARAGVKCAWNIKKNACEKHPPHRAKNGLETCPASSSASDNGSKRDSTNFTTTCEMLKSCTACTSTSFNCVWCKDECKWKSCGNAEILPTPSSSSSAQHKSNRKARFNSGFSEDNAKELEGEDHDSNGKSESSPVVVTESPMPGITKSDECPGELGGSSPKEWCPRVHTCHTCMATKGCEWDGVKVSNCRPMKHRSKLFTEETLRKMINDTIKDSSGEGKSTLSDLVPNNALPTCSLACSERSSCQNCTNSLCMWCKNLGMCVDRNAYLASFPYGQCMDWTTHSEECPPVVKDVHNTTDPDQICSGYKTCHSCRSNPSCGWCDDGLGTGIGSCMLGGATGPLVKQREGHSQVQWLLVDTCPVSEGKSWHFTSCPDCMCNGHSECTKDPKKCDQPCLNNTEGDHCERCAQGYFGVPVNGGECQACQCNGQAKECNHKTGRCHCTTKGIIGEKCERCDIVNHYYGDPVKTSCYYDLAIDYQFTFNLSKAEDKHLRGINFKNTPTKSEVDVDFSITCSVPARMNMTVKYHNGNEMIQKPIVSEQNCSLFKSRFSKDDFDFGEDSNTTFFIHVYDFEPPLWIIISFSQHPKLDLLQFFITFSTCFLALLLIAAVLWKIKQKFDRYRRRQRLFVEMEQMASRPFGSVLVELEKFPDHNNGGSSSMGGGIPNSSTVTSSLSAGELTTATGRSRSQSSSGCTSITTAAVGTVSGTSITSSGGGEITNVRRRRKRARPSPIALEPCVGNRAAVLSLIVRMPTGGKPYTPNGYTGIAIASSLVTLGNPRKASAETPQRPSLDDPKGGRKGRKTTSTSTDI